MLARPLRSERAAQLQRVHAQNAAVAPGAGALREVRAAMPDGR
ncbi:hypothetical protein CSB93_5713 [Pseudomonas paraeruginosa]|uniref:Uncharacterized protein n=1 Tax=Pseudomonas paraeruginosa TaxID=2994495 RepID=A0A2R3ITJ6_9PSED|nr:hypothetical protein CSB93_5713 [Pseudomonas paraeruginosa]AWE92719.1 hypothetical protein CSC28_4511 [Pseudomonas paraeruginosa]